MRPRQKYVRLTQAQILVLPAQQEFVAAHSARRGVSINQAVRDIIEHAMTCPFFNGNTPTNGNVAPVEPSAT